MTTHTHTRTHTGGLGNFGSDMSEPLIPTSVTDAQEVVLAITDAQEPAPADDVRQVQNNAEAAPARSKKTHHCYSKGDCLQFKRGVRVMGRTVESKIAVGARRARQQQQRKDETAEDDAKSPAHDNLTAWRIEAGQQICYFIVAHLLLNPLRLITLPCTHLFRDGETVCGFRWTPEAMLDFVLIYELCNSMNINFEETTSITLTNVAFDPIGWDSFVVTGQGETFEVWRPPRPQKESKFDASLHRAEGLLKSMLGRGRGRGAGRGGGSGSGRGVVPSVAPQADCEADDERVNEELLDQLADADDLPIPDETVVIQALVDFEKKIDKSCRIVLAPSPVPSVPPVPSAKPKAKSKATVKADPTPLPSTATGVKTDQARIVETIGQAAFDDMGTCNYKMYFEGRAGRYGQYVGRYKCEVGAGKHQLKMISGSSVKLLGSCDVDHSAAILSCYNDHIWAHMQSSKQAEVPLFEADDRVVTNVEPAQPAPDDESSLSQSSSESRSSVSIGFLFNSDESSN